MSERVQTPATNAAAAPFVSASGALQRTCACGAHSGGGECMSCRAKREPELQRAAVNSAPAAPLGQDVPRSPGQPPDAVRSFAEPRFGHDFSRVPARTPAPRLAHVPAPVLQRAPRDDDPIHRPLIEKYRREHGLPESGVDEFGRPVGPSDAQIKYGQPGVTQSVSVEQEVAEDRRRFEQAQAEYFQELGDLIRDEILKQAGLAPGAHPASTDEALKVIGLWGLKIDDIVAKLPQLGQSTASSVRGSNASTTLAAQEQALIAALTPAGQQAYQTMLKQVRAEPFWREYLDTHTVFIFPDLSGANRYSGYTQRGTERNAQGQSNPAFIIHISKDNLEAGQVAESVATLIHELSHTVYEPAVIKRSMEPFLASLAELLADHPAVAALRQGAADAAGARQTHVQRIRQLLYEQTGYAEGEIFVHLQQLTNQPAVTIDGVKVRGSRYILAQVELYLESLKRIGIPQRILLGILDSLGRRVAILYDRRIAAAPAGSSLRQSLERDKEIARLTLKIARDSTGTSR